MESIEATGLETEATVDPAGDPAGGLESQVDFNGDQTGEN